MRTAGEVVDTLRDAHKRWKNTPSFWQILGKVTQYEADEIAKLPEPVKQEIRLMMGHSSVDKYAVDPKIAAIFSTLGKLQLDFKR